MSQSFERLRNTAGLVKNLTRVNGARIKLRTVLVSGYVSQERG